MTVRLVSTNDHPTPHGHEAEWLQHLLMEDEQAEANAIAAFVADRILTFIAGIAFCLVSEIVILLIVKGWFA